MASMEASAIVQTTLPLGAMQAQSLIEREYGELKNFTILYVSYKSSGKYIVGFQYDDN